MNGPDTENELRSRCQFDRTVYGPSRRAVFGPTFTSGSGEMIGLSGPFTVPPAALPSKQDALLECGDSSPLSFATTVDLTESGDESLRSKGGRTLNRRDSCHPHECSSHQEMCGTTTASP